MIVAVTGASGFIGRHLCATIEASAHSVRRIVRDDFASDDRIRSLFDGVDVVIHAAAATRAPTRDALRASNVVLMSRVARIAKLANVGRLLYVSSQAAAGPASSLEQPMREDDVPHPIEEYGRTKLAAESIVRDSGVPFVIVRPSAVYGPGDRDFRALIELARRGVAIHPGNRAQWISIVHVRDCVDAILRAAVSEQAIGRTYFVANDAPVQWSRLFELAAQSAGARLRLDVEIPRSLVAVGAFAGDVLARATGRAGLLTTEKVRLSRDPFWVCSNERARAELAFTPTVTLADGLRELMTARSI